MAKGHDLQVRYVDIDSLTPRPTNPRTHSSDQIKQIAKLITEYGWTNPILVDEDAGVLAGHGRLAAARLLKMKTVPVIDIGGLSDAQKRAYVIADNQSALNAGWDEGLLKIEFTDLAAIDFSLELTGFSLAEIGDLMNPPNGGQSGAGSLADKFMVVPFSVLNAREGWWQDRKRAWLALGIQSEIGRGENALDMSASMAGITDEAEREEWNK